MITCNYQRGKSHYKHNRIELVRWCKQNSFVFNQKFTCMSGGLRWHSDSSALSSIPVINLKRLDLNCQKFCQLCYLSTNASHYVWALCPQCMQSCNMQAAQTINKSIAYFLTLGYFISAKEFVESRCWSMRSCGQTTFTQSMTRTCRQQMKNRLFHTKRK